MIIDYWRDGPGFYWRCKWLRSDDEDLEHTSEIEAQIYAILMGWA